MNVPRASYIVTVSMIAVCGTIWWARLARSPWVRIMDVQRWTLSDLGSSAMFATFAGLSILHYWWLYFQGEQDTDARRMCRRWLQQGRIMRCAGQWNL